MCARFQANPKESHLTAVKRILRYVNSTANFGVFFSRDTNLALADTLMLIGLEMRMIKKVLLEDVSM